jgi:nucleoside-diphosphate-sugar epimerase
MKVMEIARNFGVKYFYNFDTYFNSSKGIYSYLSEYTLTKKQFSEWGLYYSKKFEIQFINIRLEHLYGPEDGGAKFIPWLIGRCFDGSKIINLTEGEQLRDFLYVSDAVNAVALLIKNQSIFDPHYQCIGLGSGSLTSIKELALMVHALTKSKGVLCFGGLDYRENELMSSFSDAAKFRALGWYPKTSLECGLMNTIINFRKSKK